MPWEHGAKSVLSSAVVACGTVGLEIDNDLVIVGRNQSDLSKIISRIALRRVHQNNHSSPSTRSGTPHTRFFLISHPQGGNGS